jgi:hypothetical protein
MVQYLDKETFEEVPFDFRHHKAKPPTPKIPWEWFKTAKEKECKRLGLPPKPAKAPKSA